MEKKKKKERGRIKNMSKGDDESEKLIAFNSRRQTGGGGGRESPVKMIRHVIGDAILIDYHRSLPPAYKVAFEPC